MNMDFDRIEVQKISKRRRPSPLRNLKRQTAGGTDYPQKVSPRPDKIRQSTNTSTPFSRKRTQKPGNEHTFEQKVNKRRPHSNQGVNRKPGKPGISILKKLFSIIKNAAIVFLIVGAGILVIGWDSISANFETPIISFETLESSESSIISFLTAANGSLPGGMAGIWPLDMLIDPDNPAENQNVADLPPLNITKLYEYRNHNVRAGEVISGIASRYGVSMESIIAVNKIKDATQLTAGTVLRIPNMNGVPYTVRANENVSRIAEIQKVQVNAILDANDLQSDTLQPGQVLFLPGGRMNPAEYAEAMRGRTPVKPMVNPVAGRLRITSGYGYRYDPVNLLRNVRVRHFHDAIDIGGRWGTPIRAAMNGVVEEIGHSHRIWGNYIILNHNNNEYRTLYAHLSSFTVKKGERVSQGREIGKMGDSGYTTGTHLHFAVFDRGGKPVNPIGLLR